MKTRVRLAEGWRRKGTPQVLGHRGARHAAPENTLAAFDLAADEGAAGVELDVRLDGEGRVVVLHDLTLERVTRGSDPRSVEKLTARDLAAIDVGAGERVPTLEAVLTWARKRDMRVNVEVKKDVSRRWQLLREIARVLRDESPERIILSTFHPVLAAALVRMVPTLPVAWLVHDHQRILGKAPARRLVGVQAVHPQTTMTTRASIAPWQADGLIVNVWTVNDPDDARRLATLGVDAIITDTPRVILDAIRD